MAGPFKCEICDVAFTRKQHVGRHMRSHTGDKPYQCKYCPDRFARSDLLSRHVNKNHGPPGPDGKPTGGTNQHRGSNSASKAAKQSQFQSQETWNGTAMAQRRSIASYSAGAGADSEWEDLPYDGQEDSGAMPLPYNMAPRPLNDLQQAFIANDRSVYPQQGHQNIPAGQTDSLAQYLPSGSSSAAINPQLVPAPQQQQQYQISLNQPYMAGGDWSAATPAQLQHQQQQQVAFDQQIAQLNAMANLGLNAPYQGNQQTFSDLGLNISPTQGQAEPAQGGVQQFASPQYTSPAPDQHAMQYSLSSDGTISEPSRSGSQSVTNNMTPQQGYSFIPPLDPMTGQMLPGLDMDGGWTSMRAAGIDPIKKKRKTRACDRCNHSKTRCDSGFPCSRCTARRLSCHYSGPRAASKHPPDQPAAAYGMPSKHPVELNQLQAAQARLRASTSPEQNGIMPEWVNTMVNASPQPSLVHTSPQSLSEGGAAPTSVPASRINSLTRSTPTLAFTESPETSDGASSLTGAVLSALDGRAMSFNSMYGQAGFEAQPYRAEPQQDMTQVAKSMVSPPLQQGAQEAPAPKAALNGQQAAAAVIHEAALADWQQRVGQISLQDNFTVPMPVNYPQAFANAQLAKARQADQAARPGMNRQRSNSVPSPGQFGYQPGQYGLQVPAPAADGTYADPTKWAVPKLPEATQPIEQANSLNNGRRGSISRPAASVLQGQQLPMHPWQRPGQLQTLAPERPPSFLLTPMDARPKKSTSALARPGNKRVPSTTLGPDDNKRQTTEADLEVDWRAFQATHGRRSSLPNWGTPTKYMDANLNMAGFPFSEENQGFPFPSPMQGMGGGGPLGFDATKMPVGMTGGMF